MAHIELQVDETIGLTNPMGEAPPAPVEDEDEEES